jgi:flagella basal body P-ring formation protein FlgA
VRRSDLPPPGDGQALEQWAQARQPGKLDAAMPAAARVGAKPQAAAVPAATVRSLRQVLVEDLSVRLGVPGENLAITFKPDFEQLLNASEAQFRFSIEPVRVKGLGDVAWDVTILNDRGAGDKFTVSGSARAWQAQVVMAKPLSAKQVIRADDVTERRVLVDRLGDEPLLTMAQALRQQASRDLKPGTVLTARMVDAVPLAKPGQFITITLERGGIRVKTVGRAMEGGSYGQTIRVKNEATGDVYQVVLTAPQEGSIGGPRETDPAAAKASAE